MRKAVLFGAITTRDVAEAVTAAGVEIAKSEVRLPNGPIRTLGDHDVRFQLHGEVFANIRCYRCCRNNYQKFLIKENPT